MTKKKPTHYRFVGEDEYIPGVPARDLTPDEYDAIVTRGPEPLDLTKDELATRTAARTALLERLYTPDATPLDDDRSREDAAPSNVPDGEQT